MTDRERAQTRLLEEAQAAEIDRLRAELDEAWEVHVDNANRQADWLLERAQRAEAAVAAALLVLAGATRGDASCRCATCRIRRALEGNQP